MNLLETVLAMYGPTTPHCDIDPPDIDWLYEIPESTVQVWYDMIYPRHPEKRLFELQSPKPPTKTKEDGAINLCDSKKTQMNPIRVLPQLPLCQQSMPMLCTSNRADAALFELRQAPDAFAMCSSAKSHEVHTRMLEEPPVASFPIPRMLYVRDIEMSQGCDLSQNGESSRSSDLSTSPSCSSLVDASMPNPVFRCTKWRGAAAEAAAATKWQSRPKYCTFCFRNGENPDVYTSHLIRDAIGKITCPVLFYVICRNCGATGEKAHTEQHCPFMKSNC